MIPALRSSANANDVLQTRMLETAIAAALQHEQTGKAITCVIDEAAHLLLTITQDRVGWFRPNVNLRLHHDGSGTGNVGEFDAWFCEAGVQLWHHEIDPGYRRQGHGRRLVATIERYVQCIRPSMKRTVRCYTDQPDTAQLLLACGFDEQRMHSAIGGKTHVGLTRLVKPQTAG